MRQISRTSQEEGGAPPSGEDTASSEFEGAERGWPVETLEVGTEFGSLEVKTVEVNSERTREELITLA